MRTQRGSIAVILAVSLLVLVGFGALVVDLGYARLVQAQLQAGADAAALSAVTQLDGSTSGVTDAHGVAPLIALNNAAHGEPIELTPNPTNDPQGDVVTGEWDGDTHTFTASLLGEDVNAVLVRARRDDLDPWFSRVGFGTETLGASAISIAVRGEYVGAGEVPYYLPFALPDCLFDSYDPEELVDMTFTLNPAGIDNTGWARLGGQPNAAWTREHIELMLDCMHEYAETGAISEDCTAGSIEDDVSLATGEATASIRALAEAFADGLPWDSEIWGDLPDQHDGSGVDEADYGNMLVAPIPVFDSGGSYCNVGGGGWTETFPALGFVWAAVYDVRWKGAARDQNIWLRIDPTHVYPVGTGGGGDNHGVVAAGSAVIVR
ncbi:MAG: hypothetical protein H6741_28490 [Alphaproteobacteria bacterium]|nr:hypothetical protein [Alphaproteobacteria bacterium]